MKKVLALVLVLGLASMANAAMVLSVNGQTDVDTIKLLPSETVNIDIHATEAIFGGSYVLVYNVAAGSMEKGVANPNIFDEVTYNHLGIDTFADAGVEPLEGRNGYFLGFAIFATGGASIVGQLADGFVFHCENADVDGVVQLMSFNEDTWAPMDVLDTVFIDQVPEPMTMSLLALGGLGLLRRRRA